MTSSPRAFSLVEMMVVVAIFGILMSLSLVTFDQLNTHAKAREEKAAVLSAIAEARTLAQRHDAPTQLSLSPTQIEIGVARCGLPAGGEGDCALVADTVRRAVTSFASTITIPMPGNVSLLRMEQVSASGAIGQVFELASTGSKPTLRFCPSSDNYFRIGAINGPAACGLGNLASADAKIVFTSYGETHHVTVHAPLGNLDLGDGP